jgi:hypothetical protein
MSNPSVLFYNRIVQIRPLATIDIGTNTFRLLIAEVTFIPDGNHYRVKEIRSERIRISFRNTVSMNYLLLRQAPSGMPATATVL